MYSVYSTHTHVPSLNLQMPYDNLTQLFKRSVFGPDMAAQHVRSGKRADYWVNAGKAPLTIK